MLKVNKQKRIFHLSNSQISLVIQIIDNHFLVKRYLGPRIPFYAGSNILDKARHAFSVYEEDDTFSATNLPLEYSFNNLGDYRIVASNISDANGYPIGNLSYEKYDEIPMMGTKYMPHVRNNKNVSNLNIYFKGNDNIILVLHYLLLEDMPIIIKWVTVENHSNETINIDKLASLQLDLESDNFKSFTFNGTHAREFVPEIKQLINGVEEVSSKRGFSSPQHQPFMALIDKNATQDYGEYFAATLLWSGDFKAQVEKDQYHQLRMVMGVNDNTFNYKVEGGSELSTPQAILLYGKQGLNELGIRFQTFFDKHVINTRIKSPLIAFNTWETSYFNITESACKNMIEKSNEIGCNLFVLDDGWFINRNDEHGQLGDWIEDPNKFPNGLKTIADNVHKHHMKFGLWIEPEMVTKNSNLFKLHQEWVLGLNNSKFLESRNQLVLDLSNKDVQDYLINKISTLIKKNEIDYIKWDCNRQIAPLYSQIVCKDKQKETNFKYILGLYRILAYLRSRFPNLIIENCASGGGRLDGGMVYYTDQTWISDLTDAVGRFRILSSLINIYPLSICSSHLSKSPNEQNGRILSLDTRLELSGVGSFGIEMNLDKISVSEKEKIKLFIRRFKDQYCLRHNGLATNLTPLIKDDGNRIAILLQNDKEYLLIYSYGVTNAVHQPIYVPLKYLNNSNEYELDNKKYSGVELNNVGITIPPVMGDFQTKTVIIKQHNH